MLIGGTAYIILSNQFNSYTLFSYSYPGMSTNQLAAKVSVDSLECERSPTLTKSLVRCEGTPWNVNGHPPDALAMRHQAQRRLHQLKQNGAQVPTPPTHCMHTCMRA